MTSSNQTGAAVVGAIVAAGLFILSLEGQTRAFEVVATSVDARNAAIVHLTHRAQTAAKGKPHA